MIFPKISTAVMSRHVFQGMLPEALMHADEVAAFGRLIAIAQTNTGQARRVAAFLLSCQVACWPKYQSDFFCCKGVAIVDDSEQFVVHPHH
ncbi:MAG TPA: DUF7673 family protein [Xylella sp.]